MCNGPTSSRKVRLGLGRLMMGMSIAMLFAVGVAEAQPAKKWACGRTVDTNPVDYRDLSRVALGRRLPIEKAHFNTKIQRAALAGKRKGAYGNLQYTLERIPNHHHALFLMGVFQFKVSKYDPDFLVKLKRRPDFLPASCWFERAIRFRPQDVGIYNAQGRVLHMVGKHKDAIVAFKRIIELVPSSPQGHYNLGLAYYSAGNYKAAAQAARTAQKLGHKRTELIARLKRKGHWGK